MRAALAVLLLLAPLPAAAATLEVEIPFDPVATASDFYCVYPTSCAEEV